MQRERLEKTQQNFKQQQSHALEELEGQVCEKRIKIE